MIFGGIVGIVRGSAAEGGPLKDLVAAPPLARSLAPMSCP
jgi:hypothetical protein